MEKETKVYYIPFLCQILNMYSFNLSNNPMKYYLVLAGEKTE